MSVLAPPSDEARAQRLVTAPNLAVAFADEALRDPEAVAIESGADRVGYGELLARSAETATIVSRRGISRDLPVAILTRDPIELAVAVLGVLRAGGFFLLLDPFDARERMKQILEDSEASVVLVGAETEPIAAEIRPSLDRLRLDATPGGEPALTAFLSTPNDIACLGYTSGSTGRPLGVTRSHGAFLHGAARTIRRRDLHTSDRVASLFASGFAGSIAGLITNLLSGATWCAYPTRQLDFSRLARWSVEERITILRATPSLFRSLLGSIEPALRFPKMRTILLGGELFTLNDLRLFQERFPAGTKLRLTLASSEAGVHAIAEYDAASRIDGHLVPVGLPPTGSHVHIVDREGRELEAGETGEILVEGPGVSEGYWRNPELTAARFEMIPGSNERRFRTGDLGRLLPDGRLLFLGRLDDQVKIRGYRVEPAEIEAALQSHPAVRDAAVVGSSVNEGESRLLAWFTSDEQIDPRALRDWLSERLPSWAVPPAIRRVDRLPLTGNGKIDRAALRDAEDEPSGRSEPLGGLGDPLEEQIARIWRVVLRVAHIDPEDDFYDAGGDSLRAAEMLARLGRELGHELPLAILAEATTIRSLARVIREQSWQHWQTDVLVPLRSGGSRPNFFAVAALGGNIIGYHPLVEALGPDQPFYALQIPPLGADGRPPATLADISAAFIGAMREVQPRGPYYIGGYSSGGAYAFEIGRQLDLAGEEVALVALLDTHGDESYSIWLRLRQRLALLASDPLGMSRRFVREYRRRIWARLIYPFLRHRAKQQKPVPRFLQRRDLTSFYALRAIEPRPHPLPAVLFRTERKPGLPRHNDRRWSLLSMGRLRIRDLPCHHNELIREPWVRHLARELSAAIDEASRSGRPIREGGFGFGSETGATPV